MYDPVHAVVCSRERRGWQAGTAARSSSRQQAAAWNHISAAERQRLWGMPAATWPRRGSTAGAVMLLDGACCCGGGLPEVEPPNATWYPRPCCESVIGRGGAGCAGRARGAAKQTPPLSSDMAADTAAAEQTGRARRWGTGRDAGTCTEGRVELPTWFGSRLGSYPFQAAAPCCGLPSVLK